MAEDLENVVARGRVIAELENEAWITPTHMALAIMSEWSAPWPEMILERGGFEYENALRRLRSEQPRKQRPQVTGRPSYRSSMRRSLVVLAMELVSLGHALLRQALALKPRPPAAKRPVLNAEAIEVVRVAQTLADGAGTTSRPSDGHVLLALVCRPGEHLRVLPNSTVIGCAVRKRLGIATLRHRLILACDQPKCWARRLHMKLDREVATNGWRSRWGLASLTYATAGVVGAITLFFLTILVTALLYLFLWPAALLMAGIRALFGAITGCDARSYHWLKIPGGDVALIPRSRPVSTRAVAVAVLAPRVLALLACISAMVVLFWRSTSLGVTITPIVLRRPDVVTGSASEAFWLGPISILTGMLQENGAVAGFGLLAGLGAGVMSIPTFGEVELIRLHTGYEVGEGSRVGKVLMAPASLFTGAVECIEAFLPFTGAPMYATAYVVPLFFSALVAGAVLNLLPY